MTGHGFRGLASTILNENGFDEAHMELQLAHTKRNKVAAAYNHAKYLKQRTEMMQWWADYLDAQLAKGRRSRPRQISSRRPRLPQKHVVQSSLAQMPSCRSRCQNPFRSPLIDFRSYPCDCAWSKSNWRRKAVRPDQCVEARLRQPGEGLHFW